MKNRKKKFTIQHPKETYTKSVSVHVKKINDAQSQFLVMVI